MVPAARPRARLPRHVSLHPLPRTRGREPQLLPQLPHIRPHVAITAEPQQPQLLPDQSIRRIAHKSSVFANIAELLPHLSELLAHKSELLAHVTQLLTNKPKLLSHKPELLPNLTLLFSNFTKLLAY